MLTVDHLTRKYGDFIAVDDVSFSINKGEIVGLLGHNGAGKTTILKMLSGYIEANAGFISFDDVDLQTNPKSIQKKLGYLPENLPVYTDMTVADYLSFVADLKGITDKKFAEIRRVIQATDIDKKLDCLISTLSRGYKQRVGVAQAILGKPKLLILDEPTNGLDPEQTQQMRQLIIDVAKEATVILSTHIMQEVDAICSRVLLLHGGHLALDEQLNTLRCSNSLIVETSLAKDKINLLKEIQYIDSVKIIPVIDNENNEAYQYRITIDTKENTNSNLKHIAAQISKIITQNDEALYVIQPESRNLETLFKELNQGNLIKKEAYNAA